MQKILLGLLATLSLTACPKKSVTIYRSLSEPGAMQTCDANQRFRVNEARGADEKAARAAGEAQIRDTITKNKGCAALITNDGAGKALAGHWNYSADFQLCKIGRASCRERV